MPKAALALAAGITLMAGVSMAGVPHSHVYKPLEAGKTAQPPLSNPPSYNPFEIASPSSRPISSIGVSHAPVPRLPAPTPKPFEGYFPANLHGALSYSDTWNAAGSPEWGINVITPEGYNPVFVDEAIGTNSYGQVYAGDKYFVAVPEIMHGYVMSMKYAVYDTRTWTRTDIEGDWNFKGRAMTMDPISRKVYMISENEYDKTWRFAELDMSTYKVKEIRNYGATLGDWSALMSTSAGEIYGITRGGDLVNIDKLTGEYTIVGNTGLKSTMVTSGVIDPATGRCFYVMLTSTDSEMYEIDLATGAASFLFAMPGNAQLLSLYVPEQIAPETAPAAATGLSLTFEGNSFTGTLSFTMPATSIKGDNLSGQLGYTVTLNGDDIATGNADAGSPVTVPVSVTASGSYTAAVTAKQGDAAGNTAYVTTWIGNDIPAAVTGAQVAENNGKLLLTWSPPTGGTQGGHFNADDITYDIVSYPSGTTVATGVKNTSYEFDMPQAEEFTRFSYGIIAVLGDSRSLETRSNDWLEGTLTAPYLQDFSEHNCMDLFTIINANGDYRAWEYENNYISDLNGRLVINYSSSYDMDDWAVLYPMYLEGGFSYEISIDAKGTTPSYTERVELRVSASPELEALRESPAVIEPTDIVGGGSLGEGTSSEFQTLTGVFRPTTSGLYHIAIHGCSPKGQNKLYVDNLRVAAGVNTKAPAKPEITELTADNLGKLSAIIRFKAPTTNIEGKAIKELAYIMVERDGQMVGTINNPVPGNEYTFTDNNPVNGTNEYLVRAVNTYGIGEPVTATVYVGTVQPKASTEVSLSYGENTGEAHIVWEPVTEDIDGKQLGAGNVTYSLYRSIGTSSLKEVATGITDCEYYDQALAPEDEQQFVYYTVKAYAPGGSSDPAYSNIYPLGAPLATPWHEPFDAGTPTVGWMTETPAGSYTSWDVYADNELPIESFDGNGLALAYSMYEGEDNNRASLYSSLIDLSTLTTPMLTFYLYDMNSANELTVRANDGYEWLDLTTVKSDGKHNMLWRKVAIDLAALDGKTVCFEFIADNKEYNMLLIDNLRVTDDFDTNMSALSINAPDKAAPNVPFDVTVTYENSGKTVIGECTIDLYNGEDIVASANVSDIKASTAGVVEFTVTLPAVAATTNEFQAVITCQGDECEADNTSPVAVVRFTPSVLPAPRDLNGSQIETDVELAWDEPDLNTLLVNPRLDDVEAYTAFSNGLPNSQVEDDNVGEWTMLDLDGLETYGVGGGMYEYVNRGVPSAFIVYNAYQAEDNLFMCHSGHQMFLCMAGKPAGGVTHNDDWLISPLLAGCAQTISFYAHSVTTYGADTFEVLYSTTGKNPDDFTLIEQRESESDWKEYSYELPEGALYFAIRCISADKYAFMVDDITMVTEHDVIRDLEVEGYNIYCDGRRLNESPLTAMAYSHAKPVNGIHTYRTTAVYTTYGESAPSEPVEVNVYNEVGIDLVGTDGNVKVYTTGHTINVNGAEGLNVAIHTTDGLRIYGTHTATGDIKVSVAPGIYLVTAGSHTSKVRVR